jgi:hypothetical protein
LYRLSPALRATHTSIDRVRDTLKVLQRSVSGDLGIIFFVFELD